MGTKRTMISLPDDLKDRMEAAGTKVNWSAVARKAFEATLAEVQKPDWSEVSIQLFEDERAGHHTPMHQFVEDVNLSLSGFMAECKEARHDDPQFRNWYQEMRNAAHDVCIALEHLEHVTARYK